MWERLAERGVDKAKLSKKTIDEIDRILGEGVIPIKPHHAVNHYKRLEQRTTYPFDLARKIAQANGESPNRKDTIGTTAKERNLYINGLQAAFTLYNILPKSFSVRLTPYYLGLLCVTCTIGDHCRFLSSDIKRVEKRSLDIMAHKADQLDIPYQRSKGDQLDMTMDLMSFKQVLQKLP